MIKYVISLGLTLVLEGIPVAIRSKNKDWVIYVALVNILTNPPANLIFNGLKPLAEGKGEAILAAVTEAAVVAGETLLFFIYRKKQRRGLKAMSLRACFLYALVLNAVSYFGGLAIGKIT